MELGTETQTHQYRHQSQGPFQLSPNQYTGLDTNTKLKAEQWLPVNNIPLDWKDFCPPPITSQDCSNIPLTFPCRWTAG